VAEEDHLQGEQSAPCGCIITPGNLLVDDKELGMDENFAQVSLLVCPACGRQWLRYHYEMEAFTASGRWYLGAITAEQASNLTAENAKATLEGLSWYFYGGSYYGGGSGRASGSIYLNS
jgi:hypothetical protein